MQCAGENNSRDQLMHDALKTNMNTMQFTNSMRQRIELKYGCAFSIAKRISSKQNQGLCMAAETVIRTIVVDSTGRKQKQLKL